jgi:hypothetical protein
MHVRTEESTNAAYPFQAEFAFLGFAHRKADVRHLFDGHTLVCWEAWHVRALTLVAGAAGGPWLTALLLLGKIKGPWYVQAFAGAFSLLAWVGWIDALRHRYRVIFDFAGGEVRFLFHPRGAAKFRLPLAAVAGVEIETIHRVRGKHGNPMRALSADDLARGVAAIACYSLVLVRDDGPRIHVLETTDREAAEAIRSIVENGRSDRRGMESW